LFGCIGNRNSISRAYSAAMLSEFSELTETLVDGLPSPNSPTPTSNNNVVRLKR